MLIYFVIKASEYYETLTSFWYASLEIVSKVNNECIKYQPSAPFKTALLNVVDIPIQPFSDRILALDSMKQININLIHLHEVHSYNSYPSLTFLLYSFTGPRFGTVKNRYRRTQAHHRPNPFHGQPFWWGGLGERSHLPWRVVQSCLRSAGEVNGGCQTCKQTDNINLSEFSNLNLIRKDTLNFNWQVWFLNFNWQVWLLNFNWQVWSLISIGKCGSSISTGKCGSSISIGKCGSLISIGKCGSLISIGKCGSSISSGKCGSSISIGKCGSLISSGKCGSSISSGKCGP